MSHWQSPIATFVTLFPHHIESRKPFSPPHQLQCIEDFWLNHDRCDYFSNRSGNIDFLVHCDTHQWRCPFFHQDYSCQNILAGLVVLCPDKTLMWNVDCLVVAFCFERKNKDLGRKMKEFKFLISSETYRLVDLSPYSACQCINFYQPLIELLQMQILVAER